MELVDVPPVTAPGATVIAIAAVEAAEEVSLMIIQNLQVPAAQVSSLSGINVKEVLL